MARKHQHQHEPAPGDDEYLPLTADERRAHADALHQRAERDQQPASLLAQAAEYYAIDGHDSLAEQLFRHALAEPGAPVGAVHGYYADFLFDHDRVADALELIHQARRLKPTDPDVFTIIGETLLEHDHPAEAVKWFTAGLVRMLGTLADIDIDDLHDDIDAAMLARGRHEARHALNQPADHLDEIYELYRAQRTAE